MCTGRRRLATQTRRRRQQQCKRGGGGGEEKAQAMAEKEEEKEAAMEDEKDKRKKNKNNCQQLLADYKNREKNDPLIIPHTLITWYSSLSISLPSDKPDTMSFLGQYEQFRIPPDPCIIQPLNQYISIHTNQYNQN